MSTTIQDKNRLNKTSTSKTNDQKTILITGASSGIGQEVAIYFAENGWRVFATMRNPEARKDTTAAFVAHPNITLLHLDVLDPASIEKAVRAAIDGSGSIDVLLNNAGYAVMGPFEASSREQIQKQFETNVFGLMEVTRAVLPIMKKQGSGLIINVSSMGGLVSFPAYSLYNSTKFAVEGFSESLRYELEPFGIWIKLIEPSVVKTEFYGRSMDVMKVDAHPEYDAFIKRVTANMANSSTSLHPRDVAKVIFRAATDGKKRFRYPVGKDANDIALMRKVLPDSVFERFFRSIILK